MKIYKASERTMYRLLKPDKATASPRQKRSLRRRQTDALGIVLGQDQ